MDFLKLSGDSRAYNFHCHTQFCDGRATMEEFVRMAVACGFTHLGFSPHSPILCESKCNMAREAIPEYLAEFRRLKGIYGEKIRLYASMEIDYMGKGWGPSCAYFQSLPLDYRIGSIHFIPSDQGYVDVDGRIEGFKEKMARYFHNDIRHVVESFYKETMAMIEAGGFDLIGHYDKIGHNASLFSPGIEQQGWYLRIVDDVTDLIIEKGVTVELNTKFWDEYRRMFPSQRCLKRLVSSHVPIVVNSDFHYPAFIIAGRERGFALLDSLALQNNQ